MKMTGKGVFPSFSDSSKSGFNLLSALSRVFLFPFVVNNALIVAWGLILRTESKLVPKIVTNLRPFLAVFDVQGICAVRQCLDHCIALTFGSSSKIECHPDRFSNRIQARSLFAQLCI